MIQTEILNVLDGPCRPIREFLERLATLPPSWKNHARIRPHHRPTNQLTIIANRNGHADRVLTDVPPLIEHFLCRHLVSCSLTPPNPANAKPPTAGGYPPNFSLRRCSRAAQRAVTQLNGLRMRSAR